MADKHKTKAEILQELESIKGLLQEEDHIPILQEMEAYEWHPEPIAAQAPQPLETTAVDQHESVLPGQGSLFDQANVDESSVDLPTTSGSSVDEHPADETPVTDATPARPSTSSWAQYDTPTDHSSDHTSPTQEQKKPGFASHLPPLHSTSKTPNNPRPLTKGSGENPFLPQHIRERLHGNNPPPLFEYETAKKIINATKNIAHKTNKPRQHLIDDVIRSMMPRIESELRQRLFAMSVEELEELLNEEEDR